MPDKLLKELFNMVQLDIKNFSLNLESLYNIESYGNEISEAHRYPLTIGGKRIRPIFVLLVAGAFVGRVGVEIARKSALAIEQIHTYSLVHDDLPCLDNDDLRRGQPTTHKVYGEAKALLVGDGLLTNAFLTIATTAVSVESNINFIKYLVESLAKASGPEGMVWGQWLDYCLVGNNNVTWEQMKVVHKNKTGKLLGSCFELGFICAVSTFKKVIDEKNFLIVKEKLRVIGENIGLVFQIIDDILDTTKTTSQLGKTAGKDEAQDKFTAVRLLGLEKAEELSKILTQDSLNSLKEIFLEEIFSANDDEEKKVYQNLLIEQIKLLLLRSH